MFGKCRAKNLKGIRCKRERDHAGAHADLDYGRTWFDCVECGLPTENSARICDHCHRAVECTCSKRIVQARDPYNPLHEVPTRSGCC